MKHNHQPGLTLAAAQSAFQVVAVAVSGLYVATHSIAVTAIGATAATALASWAAWLLHQRRDTAPKSAADGHEEIAAECSDAPSES
jgi:hypothetical protein